MLLKLLHIIPFIVFASVFSTAQQRIAELKNNAQHPVEKDSVQGKLDTMQSQVASYQQKITKAAATILKQKDTVVENLKEVPAKFIKDIDNKIEKYSGRITKKTEKTLTKLSNWENKIRKRLKEISPETEKRLFGDNQLTFSVLLQKMKDGEGLAKKYRAKYDSYNDKLSVSLKYLDEQKQNLDEKLLQPLSKAKAKMNELNETVDNTELIQQLIKERKKQLIDGSLKALGKSKYLAKLDKETWYYLETMRNYKQLFNEPEKAEQTAKGILNKIPAFQRFFKNNSQLASIFGFSAPSDNPAVGANAAGAITGLQTRASVQQSMQANFGAGQGKVQQLVSQNVQAAQAEINKLKDQLIKKGGSGEELSMPDFKPNMQKTKTFWQRIEYGFDIQFAKNNSLLPVTTDIALTVGYKLNDKSTLGTGISYKAGLGTIKHIKVTHQGIGLRSYLDWKLKKKFSVTGGYEMNYNAQFKNIKELKNSDVWQQSALIGVTKKFNVKAKWFKATRVQLFFDLLSRQHIPQSQQILFRVGYNF